MKNCCSDTNMEDILGTGGRSDEPSLAPPPNATLASSDSELTTLDTSEFFEDEDVEGTWIEHDTRCIKDGKLALERKIRFKLKANETRSDSRRRLRRFLCYESDSSFDSDASDPEMYGELATKDIDNDEPMPKYVEHETLWYHDGNVLLQIGDVCFKLYQSRLAARSPWFKNLFDRHYSDLEGNDFDDQEEIDRVVDTCVVVDGCVLFVLDSVDPVASACAAVTAQEFAIFLTAMDDGIDLLVDKLTFADLQTILRVATDFRFSSYAESVVYVIGQKFATEPAELHPDTITYAVDAIKLYRDYGHLYPNLYILPRCAFYALARDNRTTTSPEDGSAQERGIEEESKIKVQLEDLSPQDLILLMDVQKQLSLSWEVILNIVASIDCPSKRARARVYAVMTYARKNHLFDPITGIKSIADENWDTELCCTIKNPLLTKLEEVKMSIWEDINLWLKINMSDA